MERIEYQIPCKNYFLHARRMSPVKAINNLILAHGAGAGINSLFMESFQKKLAELGAGVTEFNFSYKNAGKKAPSPKRVLEDEWRALIEDELDSEPVLRLFIGGKSMGGRIASYIVSEFAQIRGLVFLGYPLHPPGKPDKLRTEHLFEINKPMLFIAGSNDRLAQLDRLKETITNLGARATLYLIENGDHSLQVPKKLGSTEQGWLNSCKEIVKWMRDQS